MSPFVLRLVLLVLTAALLPAGEPVVFHAGWFPSAQLAGVFVALDRGFYREAGLDVTIEPFAFGQDSAARMDRRPQVCAVGSIEAYILLQKREAGTDLKALAAMLQESPAGYLSLRAAKIARVQDFIGRRLGVHQYAEKIHAWFLDRAALRPGDVQMRVVGDDVTLLTRGELDVMQGYACEEFVRLQALSGETGRFLSFASLGFASYSEILYTTGAQAARHTATLHRFLAATRRGWVRALAEPDETAAILAAHLGPDADQAHLRRTLAAVRPYVGASGRPPLAPMSAGKWRALQQAAGAIGLVSRAEPVEDFMLNW